MKEIIQMTACDPCYRDGTPRVDARTVHVTINGREFTIDVCDIHDVEYVGNVYLTLKGKAETVEQLPEIAAPVEQRVRPKSPGYQHPTGEFACPVCPDRAPSPRPDLLIAHIQRMHGITIEQPQKCPDCPAEIEGSKYMVQHRTRVHGYSQLGEYLGRLASQMRQVA